MIQKILSFFLYWLPSAIIITLFAGLVYVAVQQDFRQSANDPQIQVAEDMAVYLAAGISPQALISTGAPLEISKSIGTFAAVFDESQKLVLSSAKLRGKDIALPSGVFDVAKAKGENRITWQPEPGVRSAIVVEHYSGPSSGFVVVGRSLREIEQRENQLSGQVLLVWLVSLCVSLLGTFFKWKKTV